MGEKLHFDSIKKHRGSYFVDYGPPLPGYCFAVLQLTFLDEVGAGNFENTLEQEALTWIDRYPVPLMATAWDCNGDMLSNNESGASHFFAWIDPGENVLQTSWKLEDLNDETASAACPSDLAAIYEGISFRTETEIQKAVHQEYSARGREIKALRIVLILWLAAIPLGYALIEFFGPEWLGLLALGVVVWNAAKTSLRIFGRWPEDEKERADQEKDSLMRHYFYHCERNPKGFQRLKVENFKEDKRLEIKKKAEGLAGPES